MKKMHLKKRKKYYKFFLFVVLVVLSYFISFMFILKNKKIKEEKYIDFFIDSSINNDIKYKFIVNESIKLLSKIDLKEPSTLLDKNISSSKVIPAFSVKKEKIKEEKVEEEKKEEPIMYIYNSHQHETYDGDNYSVMDAARLLKDKLKEKGIDTLFEESSVVDYINISGISYNKYYGTTRIFIEEARKKYPTIKYLIDIHRDGIEKQYSTININEKNYAKILFVISNTNDNYFQNKEEAQKISDKINSKYPNLSRGLFYRSDTIKTLYNQDLSKYTFLIEIGANENTKEEVINTIDVLSEAIYDYIKEDI